MTARTACLLIAALAFPAVAGQAEPVSVSSVSSPALAAEDQADIRRIEAYLEGVRTLRARFTQTTSEGGIARGTLHLSRPGKMLLDYDPPAVIRIIATGGWIRVIDTELESVTPLPISETPLSLLIGETIRFSDEIRVRRVARAARGLGVTVVRKGEEDAGEVTLYLRDNPLRLAGWQVLDAAGVTTEVLLQRLETNIAIAPGTFIIDENFGVD